MINLVLPIILSSLTLNPDLVLSGDKIKKGISAPYEGMLLTPPSWLLLRSHFKADTSKSVLLACEKSCETQINLILERCDYKNDPDNALLTKSMLLEISFMREEQDRLSKKADRSFWFAVSAAAVAVTLTGVLLYTHRD